MQVQVVSPDWFILPDHYETDGVADRKNIVTVLDSSGKPTRVHKHRLVPASDMDRYAAVKAGNRLKAVCPHCGRHIEIIDHQATCPIHGTKSVVSNAELRASATERTKEPTEMTAKAESSIPLVDLTKVATFGDELWTNNNLKFSDPKTDAKAHALISVRDGVVRKLCFNTYNGTLGKRKGDPVELLHLQDFKDGKELPKDNGVMIYVLKGTLEQARAKLKKSGYTLAGGEG